MYGRSRLIEPSACVPSPLVLWLSCPSLPSNSRDHTFPLHVASSPARECGPFKRLSAKRPRDSARFWARVATKQPVRKFIISHNGQSGRRNIEERSIRINVHSTTVNARIAIVFRWPAIVSVLCRAFLLLDLGALATMLFSLVAFK